MKKRVYNGQYKWTRRSFLLSSFSAFFFGLVKSNPREDKFSMEIPAGIQEKKPNILLVTTDQQSIKDMSCAGNPYVKTPTLDSLAARGVRFEKSYSAFPLSTPARACWVTSRMPYEIDITTNEQPIPDDVVTLGERFRDSGYKTYWTGKWHVPSHSPRPGSNDVVGFEVLPYTDPLFDGNVKGLDENTVNSAVKFLKDKPSGPFLLSVSLINPHDICRIIEKSINNYKIPTDPSLLPPLPENLNAPDLEDGLEKVNSQEPQKNVNLTWDDLTLRRHSYQYYRFTELVDKQIGQILTALRESGLEENTYIVFTSDHGESNGSHRRIRKTSMYDEALSVPFIISGPGISQGVIDKVHLVSSLDVYPTLCGAAGINPPSGLRGKSIINMLRNPDTPWRQFAFSQNGQNGTRIAVSEQYKFAFLGEKHEAYGKPVREAFFDLKNDPGEANNLINDVSLKQVIDKHRSALKAWIKETGDKFVY